MQSNISLLIDSIRSASKFLYRDYFELENLQSSSKNTKNFVDKSCSRVTENLNKYLGKYYNTIIFDQESVSTTDFNSPVALVEVLDGISNFERAIPFFAVLVTILTKKNDQVFAEKMVINFPALGEVYYAEKGKGAWVERPYSSNPTGGALRLRVSNSKLEDALVNCNYQQLELAKKISSNIRIFESYSYQIALLISGKSDCSLFPNQSISTEGVELLIREAGGLSYILNNIVIASNSQLHEKLKQILV